METGGGKASEWLRGPSCGHKCFGSPGKFWCREGGADTEERVPLCILQQRGGWVLGAPEERETTSAHLQLSIAVGNFRVFLVLLLFCLVSCHCFMLSNLKT